MRIGASLFLSSTVFLLVLPLYSSDPDPVELGNEDPPIPSPPPGGHWPTIEQAKEACQFVCTRAYPRCAVIGCVPRREENTIEGCRITCCGDTSHTYCWSCQELKPGETPDSPPASCLPTESEQNSEAAGAAESKKLADKPPTPDANLPKDPVHLYELSRAHYQGKTAVIGDTKTPAPPSSSKPVESIPANPTVVLPSTVGKDDTPTPIIPTPPTIAPMATPPSDPAPATKTSMQHNNRNANTEQNAPTSDSATSTPASPATPITPANPAAGFATHATAAATAAATVATPVFNNPAAYTSESAAKYDNHDSNSNNDNSMVGYDNTDNLLNTDSMLKLQ